MEEPLSKAEWRKSSRSGQSGNCVEVAGNLPGIVAVRDSYDPDGPALILDPAAWHVLTRRVRNGELDLAGIPALPAKSPVAARSTSPGRSPTQVQPGAASSASTPSPSVGARARPRKPAARHAAGARGITPG